MRRRLSHSRLFSRFRYLAFVAVLLGAASSARAQRPPAPGVAGTLRDIEAASAGRVTSAISPATGLVTFLRTPPASPVTGRLAASAPAEARARALLQSYGRAFGLIDANAVAVVDAGEMDEVGMEHVRFRQVHRGIPVTGGEVTVHLRDAGLVAVHARTLSELDAIDLVPGVTAGAAELAVERLLEARLGISAATLSEPRLELFNRGLLEGRTTPTRLAWFIEARAIDLRELVWVDAHAGVVLLSFSQLTDARDRKVHDANDPASGVFGDLPGTLVRSEGGPAVVGAAASDANDAYRYSGDTYDYFFDQHGRDSYDDAGATLRSTVRFCPGSSDCPFTNAFWNGDQMVYGAGFSRADDVDAHELTHAVTEHTANLFYYMQSGALNESYSDIFGETVDLLNGSGTDSAGARWLMGEDLPGLGPIRNMRDPTAFGNPGKMSDDEFLCGDYQADQGGVHLNSGVPNHAYALMVDGGSYNGANVTGIGLVKAGKIQYRALANYLVSASDFLDNYHALIQSCEDLIGVAGITEGDCTEVAEALDAVEMDETWPCGSVTQSSPPALCPAGQFASVFAAADFENVPIAACPVATLPTSWCTNGPDSGLGSYATNGERSGWGYDRPTLGTLALQLTVPGILPENARLQFDHSFGFDSFSPPGFWDGGRIETRVGGGGPWTDAGALIVGGQPYGGTVSACCGNPLGGKSAFVGQSFGFTASQLDLGSFAGSSLAFRFNIGTDGIIDDFGWFVDDIRLYTCVAGGALDVDGDGEVASLTDGLLIQRYLFGLRGTVLVAGAVDTAACTRCLATEIESHVASVLAQLDVDDDGESGPLSDALLVVRYLFGFRDAVLVAGAVDTGNCNRCSAPEIEAYLQSVLGSGTAAPAAGNEPRRLDLLTD